MDNESYFFVFWHMQLYMSWYIRSFFGFTFLNILYFFCKYSCTNIFCRRSLYTFYWSIAIPRMTYGLEVVPMDDSHIEELSQAHRVHASIVQHLPENAHKPTVLSTIGWMSMPAYIAYRKLLFLWSILCLPVNNIYRRIVVAILVSCDIFGPVKLSPIGDTFKYICKYGLKDLFMSCIIRNDGNSKEMKTQLKRTIWEYEICCWKATQLLYPELDLYHKMVRNISVNVWWQIAARNPISTSKIRSVVAIASGTQPKGLQCNFRYQQCRLCCEQRLDDAMHILFQCPTLEATRSNTWTAVLDALPNAMAADISRKSWHAVLHLILSGFGDQCIPERKSIYLRTACFIHSMYKERYQMYRDIQELWYVHISGV